MKEPAPSHRVQLTAGGVQRVINRYAPDALAAAVVALLEWRFAEDVTVDGTATIVVNVIPEEYRRREARS